MEQDDLGSLEWLSSKGAWGTAKLLFQEGGGHRGPLRRRDGRSLRGHAGGTAGPEKERDLLQVT